MRILLTGTSSFLGFHLQRSIPDAHVLFGMHNKHSPQNRSVRSEAADLTDPQALRNVFSLFCPEVVVHAAAITSVAECDKDPARAFAVNSQGTRNIAALCTEFSARLIHISTDMIFDGEKSGCYAESDQANPTTVYGQSKLQGEEAVMALCPAATVLRPTLMLGWEPAGKGFLYWMAQQAREGKRLRLFLDQVRTPVSVDDVCGVIWHFVNRPRAGVFHVGGPDRVNRVELGEKFLSLLGCSELVEPITIAEAGVGYAIQKNLCLNSAKIRTEVGRPFMGVERILQEAARMAPPQEGTSSF